MHAANRNGVIINLKLWRRSLACCALSRRQSVLPLHWRGGIHQGSTWTRPRSNAPSPYSPEPPGTLRRYQPAAAAPRMAGRAAAGGRSAHRQRAMPVTVARPARCRWARLAPVPRDRHGERARGAGTAGGTWPLGVCRCRASGRLALPRADAGESNSRTEQLTRTCQSR
jgi:hypothetical protein